MSQMEYGKPETTENKPLEKVETFEQEVPESPPVEDASGESEIGKNGFTEADADVDLSRDAAPDQREPEFASSGSDKLDKASEKFNKDFADAAKEKQDTPPDNNGGGNDGNDKPSPKPDFTI